MLKGSQRVVVQTHEAGYCQEEWDRDRLSSGSICDLVVCTKPNALRFDLVKWLVPIEFHVSAARRALWVLS